MPDDSTCSCCREKGIHYDFVIITADPTKKPMKKFLTRISMLEQAALLAKLRHHR